MKGYRFREMAGKRVLIVGDIGAGKTALTARLLDEAVSEGCSREITAIDLAPTVQVEPAGGELELYSRSLRSVRVLRPRPVRAPRLEASSPEEVKRLAEENAAVIEGSLMRYLAQPSKILFINDLTLYLHSGKVSLLREVLSRSETCIANAYRGERLKDDLGSGLSAREEALLKELESDFDLVIQL